MKNLFPMLMMTTMLVVLVTSNIYLTRKVSWIFSLESRTWLHVLFAVLPVAMIVGMIGFSNSVTAMGSLGYKISAVLTGLVLYFLIAFLATDLIHLFLKLRPTVFGVFAFSLTLAVSIYGVINATIIRTSNTAVTINGLSQEIRVMHLSDIHLGHFRGRTHFEKLVDKTLANDPDLVVITGDLFDGRIQLSAETLAPLGRIDVPVFFIEGNHDKYSGVKEIKNLLRDIGVRVLENELDVHRDLQIVGLNHMQADPRTRSYPPNPTQNSVKQVLDSLAIDPTRPAILLHHSPDGMQHAVENGIDLYLSGHTHGGQLFPVNFINDLIFKYNRGLYKVEDSHIFVSQGSGTFGPPMRVGTKSEVVLVRLTPSSTEEDRY